MSSKVKAIGKQLNKKLIFEEEMYYNLYGSLVICAYLFEPGKYDANKINKVWRKFMKGRITFPAFSEDENWYSELLKVFDMEIPKNWSIAFVQSKHNALFVPYISGTVLPLREDGITCRTIETGEVYPIEWN